MIANIVITVAICAIGIAIVEYSGLDSRVYIAVGMLAGAINVKIK